MEFIKLFDDVKIQQTTITFNKDFEYHIVFIKQNDQER
jgi:hypothetical protein